MMSKKQVPNSEHKHQQKFMCCSCFGRKRSSSNFSVIGLSDQNEQYEYIVEKLAIKKVPLSLFATAEDLEKRSKTISSTSTPSTVSKKSEKAGPTTFPLVTEKKSSVTFSAYYKLTPKPDIEQLSHTIVPQHESPSLTSLHYDEPVVTCNTAFQHTTKPKTVMTEDQEKEIVSQILNKHSSLFTLDTKSVIPKDPDNLPQTNRVVVPPYVQAVLHQPKQEQFPPIHGRRQIHVDVHRAHDLSPPKLPLFMPPMKNPATIPPSKRELTPELKQTINALGFAQRPHLPGVPPKNQRSLQGGSICDGVMEKEMSCNLLAGDCISEETPSQEMACHGLEFKEKRLLCKPVKKKAVTVAMRSAYEESDYDCCNSSSSKMQYLQSNVPRFGRNLIAEQCSTAQNNKSILTAPNRSSNHIQTLPTYESAGTSEPRLQDSEQITEISQLKGQSLKWKIIIKHHSDKKDKEDTTFSEKSDISDSDSESKPYLLSSRSLSPHR